MSIEEKAKQAWQEEKVLEEAKWVVDTEKCKLHAKRFFEDIFGVVPDVANWYNADVVYLEHEGYKFRCYETETYATPKRHTFLTWLDVCPECGEIADGQDFSTLAEFGQALEEGWQPADWHVGDECNK